MSSGPSALPPVVLIVDDDQHIRELCRLYLEDAGMVVREAEDGPTALAMLERQAVDLVVLDWMLPGIDGYAVLERIRRREAWLAVVMLTALGTEEDRVMGLEMGADDYLTKPFSPKELVARVRSVLRRSSLVPTAPGDQIIRTAGLVIDGAQRTVLTDAGALVLTPREFDLLWFFASHPGQVLSRNLLLDRVWGFDYEGDGRTVDVHVTRLRQKLQKSSPTYEYLNTVWGQGYRFAPKLTSS